MKFNIGVRISIAAAAVGLVLASGPGPNGGPEDGRGIAWAGVRSSSYGIKPFPSPEGWIKAIEAMTGYFEGSSPTAIWLVGELRWPSDVFLAFPGGGKRVPHVQFGEADRHEAYLDAFDAAGVKVFLQVEPAQAEVESLIDLVLGLYAHHPCVAGFGIDVEWLREADRPGLGCPVTDEDARDWEARVKSWNPGYRLFLKHWKPEWMPPLYRGEIIFVDDSQIFKSREEMVKEFTVWAALFAPSPVIFQVGYRSDKPWWSRLRSPRGPLGTPSGRASARRLELSGSILP